MNNRKNNIEEILSSLDAMHRATAPDFFYTRLKARLERENAGGSLLLKLKRSYRLLRPAYAFSILAIVLLINVFALLKKNVSVEESVTDTELSQSFLSDYNLNNNSIYDLADNK